MPICRPTSSSRITGYREIDPLPIFRCNAMQERWASFYNRPGENYGSRPGATYGNALQAYRAPAANTQREFFGRQSSSASMGRGFAQSYGKPAHSGGFHLFGGGHGPKSFGGGKPKGFSGGKSYGGHSGGGGHGSGKHHH